MRSAVSQTRRRKYEIRPWGRVRLSCRVQSDTRPSAACGSARGVSFGLAVAGFASGAGFASSCSAVRNGGLPRFLLQGGVGKGALPMCLLKMGPRAWPHPGRPTILGARPEPGLAFAPWPIIGRAFRNWKAALERGCVRVPLAGPRPSVCRRSTHMPRSVHGRGWGRQCRHERASIQEMRARARMVRAVRAGAF